MNITRTLHFGNNSLLVLKIILNATIDYLNKTKRFDESLLNGHTFESKGFFSFVGTFLLTIALFHF